MLSGKGWFIWQILRCERGAAEAIAEKAAAAGVTHVLLKVAERTYGFGFDKKGQDLVPDVARALRAQGIQVWGWHYVYGDKPADEARIAVRRSVQLQLDGYVIDAEAEYRRPGMAAAARLFMSTLREGLPGDTLVALSSFRYPSLHRQLPWKAFLDSCDLNMPQVYWEQSHNPKQQLARCVDEFANIDLVGVVRPVVPTGAAYGAGNWRSAPDDIQKFLSKARSLGLPAANLYSWDYATSAGNEDLWQSAAGYDWPSGQTVDADDNLAAVYIEALNSGDPAQVLDLYQPNAGHVTSERILMGREALERWYSSLLTEVLPAASFRLLESHASATTQHFRWTAASPAGQVFDGEDTMGMLQGRIQYHYTSYNITRA